MNTVRNKNSLFAAAAVLGLVAFATSHAEAASANGTANATIVQAIGITAGNTLEFGTIGNAANTVTISTAGARSASDATQLAGGTPQAASFNITGQGTSAYTITLPASATITDPVSLDTMTVNNFMHDAGGAPALVGGVDSFNVGADLTVGALQTAGAYTGAFAVTVNY